MVFFRKDRGHHFLRAGLPHAACNPNNRDIQLFAVELGNVFQRLQCGFHEYTGHWAIFLGYLRKDGRRAFFDGRWDKVMPIHPCAFHWDKQKPFLHLAAVCNGALNHLFFLGLLSHISPMAGFCNILQCHIFHSMIPYVLLLFHNPSTIASDVFLRKYG